LKLEVLVAENINIMAEERQNQASGGGRRRYFRRRQRVGKSPETNVRETSTAETPKSNRVRSSEKVVAAEREERTPAINRRRRSRARITSGVIPRAETPDESIVNLDDYVPPTSVFIYSHILRPDARDSYEFRAEHFSRVGRKLEDYQIDVSVLFPEEGAVQAPVRRIDPALLDDDMNGDDE
jgi:hypothetical protein